jgi:hypothetical protein
MVKLLPGEELGQSAAHFCSPLTKLKHMAQTLALAILALFSQDNGFQGGA